MRRLHSLTGIVPIGFFLIEHFLSNAFATNGPSAYAKQVKFLTGLPFAVWLEVLFIYIPILYHGIYGIFIWYRGEGNVGEYTWAGNWLYTVQRWTGVLAFAYMGYHVYVMRILPPHLFDAAGSAFGKVQAEFTNPAALVAYTIGIVAASWHFGYGLFLFCAKWGIVVGEKARRRMMALGMAVAVLFMVVGLYTMIYIKTYPKHVPADEQFAGQVEAGEYDLKAKH